MRVAATLQSRIGSTWLSLGREGLLGWGLILALACLNNYPLLTGQLMGDDEPNQLTSCEQIIERLRDLNLVDASKVFSLVENPPLRYLLALPGQALFAETEWGPRIGSILVALAMTYAIVQLGRELGGTAVGFMSGILVAASAVYSIVSLPFGWSMIVLGLVQAMRLLRVASLDLGDRQERRRFYLINVWLGLAFLTSTAVIPFVGMTLVLYVLRNARARPAATARTLAVPLAGYAAYHLYFWVVVPVVGSHFFGKTEAFGQYGHTFDRADLTGLGFEAFLSALRALNAHFFPFVAWALAAAGLVYLLGRERRLVGWIAPYMVIWGFYVTSGGEGYFLLSAILLVPFAVALCYEGLGSRRASSVLGLVALAFAVWSSALFVRSYPEDEYPGGVLEATYSQTVANRNLEQPYEQISRDVSGVLPPGNRYVDDLSGSFSEFYANPDRSEFVDPRRAAVLGSGDYPVTYEAGSRCFRLARPDDEVRVVLTKKRICPDQVARTIRYPHSDIGLYVLRPA